jgi:hypothetical protein
MMKILLPLVLAVLMLFQGYGGYSSAQVNNVCDSKLPRVVEVLQYEQQIVAEALTLHCATDEVVTFSFLEPNSKWGWHAIDRMAKLNYTLSDVVVSGVNFYVIMTK